MKPDFEKTVLIPAIVQEYCTKQVLMLAYVNEESYEYMLRERRTCFYSRSREKLWVKGEESGNFQEIKEMFLDCDSDTLLILVEQTGVACHTGTYSCFFNQVVSCGEALINDNIIENIYSRIKERKFSPKEGSYTNYLLDTGIDKVCKKIGEETAETIIAAKNTGKEELIGEISDLTYHILVLMFIKDITVEDVKIELRNKYKIEGNKKMQNKKGEY